MYDYTAIIEINNKEQRIISLTAAKYLIGRSLSCDIVLPNDKVSRRHASLIFMPPNNKNPYSYYVIKDEQSQNGTWVGGERITNILALNDKDIISFGTGRYYPSLIFLIDKDKYINNSDSPTFGHEIEICR